MVERYGFASDNTAPICPEAWAALKEANADYAAAYGDDRWTGAVCDRVREIFETDCEVYLVFTGTAANALALAQMCQSFHSIVSYQNAHIQTDECGAPEFFGGGLRLVALNGKGGKLKLHTVEAALDRHFGLRPHQLVPAALSLTQATEFGTVYQASEIAALAALARVG